MLFSGSEILNPSLCSLGIRNSKSFLVLFGGSEILNRLSFSMEGPLASRNYLAFFMHGLNITLHFKSRIGHCLEEFFDSLQTGKLFM